MKNILIEDVTLKLYGKNDPLALGFKEKLDLAKKLGELDVDAIELCPNFNDKADEVLVKTVCAYVKNTLIACDCGSTIENIEKTVALLSSAKNKRLIVSVPVSPVRIEYYVSKKPKVVLETLATLTKKAVSLCNDVEVAFEDATRAELGFLCEAIKTAISNGANRVSLIDLAGTMLPCEFEKFICDIYNAVPELKSVTLSVQCSNELSMAMASILTAVTLGACAVKVSALGDFNLPSITLLSNTFESIGNKKGYACSINKTALNKIVDSIGNIGNKSVVAPVKDVESAEIIGSELSIDELTSIIKKRGYALSGDDSQKVYENYKRLASKKSVSIKELDVIIATCAMQVKETYSLVRYAVTSSNVISSTASVFLTKNGAELNGVSLGNGSVDAAFRALEVAIGRHFDLDAFEIDAVTEGGEAVGQTLVKLRNNGKIYSGRGISTDIVGASIRAYINALNKIVYEEEE